MQWSKAKFIMICCFNWWNLILPSNYSQWKAIVTDTPKKQQQHKVIQSLIIGTFFFTRELWRYYELFISSILSCTHVLQHNFYIYNVSQYKEERCIYNFRYSFTKEAVSLQLNSNVMSVLCERPDSEFFHSVPHLHDAVHNFGENEVRAKLPVFGQLFVKHNVTREFGLAMVHRHFDISEREVLVETINDEKSISVTSPWIIEGTKHH